MGKVAKGTKRVRVRNEIWNGLCNTINLKWFFLRLFILSQDKAKIFKKQI